ncbi:MAG: hypothetical protein JKX85_05645 [Phycisphaeraceae bacterium]|nr:hypothetical protein [Phycisphaeraceae bacterium]
MNNNSLHCHLLNVRHTAKKITGKITGMVLISAMLLSFNATSSLLLAGSSDDSHGKMQMRTSRISDESVPNLNVENFIQRPKPLLELGNTFLGTGDIAPGIDLPGGAVWQPSLLIYGVYRTAFQTFHDGDTTRSEWTNRLDIFGNLQLTGSERVHVSLRPLEENNSFSGYNFDSNHQDGSGPTETFNAKVRTLFFEGDLGELFPNADPNDVRSLDLGFSVGRQPLFYQDGMLINDIVDAVGITRNTLLPKGGADLQATFIYGWNELHRANNIENNNADVNLYGLFFAADYPKSTIHLDLVYVDDTDLNTDGFYWATSSVQRIGHYNTTFRVMGSHALDVESAAVRDGVLLFSEVSWTPAWSDNIVYINAYWGIDQFSSVARDPSAGGPLGRVGVLFDSVGIGRYDAPLSNRANDSFGAALGYQMFLGDGFHEQLVLEVGGRQSTTQDSDGFYAIGARYQKALDQHWVLQLDAFASLQESRDEGYGSRIELRYQF